MSSTYPWCFGETKILIPLWFRIGWRDQVDAIEDCVTMNSTSLDEARAAKACAYEVFRRKAAVVGVGITHIDGGYGLKVNLESSPSPGANLPETIEGVPVRIEVVGKIRKRGDGPD
jgi:hypothetical protein